MAKEHNATPSQKPGRVTSLLETLTSAIKQPKVAKQVQVELQVDGGLHEQAYHFRFEATGDGSARSEFSCRLSSRQKRKDRGRISSKRFTALLKRIVKSGILNLPATQQSFLPDTVVGCLKISYEGLVHKYYFAADPDQAAVQKQETPDELLKAVNAVYAEGAYMLGVRSVKSVKP